MRTLYFTLFFLLASIPVVAQGTVRFFDTLDQLLRFNPIASATGPGTVYEVGRKSTNSPWGAPRVAIWTQSTNAVPNGTNVFSSPFGGRWVFYDKDDPVQNALWYADLTNRWSIDHLGNLVLGTTNVASDLADLRNRLNSKAESTNTALAGHDHPVVDIRDSTALTRMLVQESAPDGIRALLLLGNSATRDVGTSSDEVAQGDHNHDGVYDLINTAANLISVHSGETNPHAVYILGASGTGTNLTIVGGTISGTVALSLGSDLSSGGDHRVLFREATTGNWRTMDRSYFRGWLDLHASNIVDSGVAGIQLLQSANRTNALDVLGTGRAGSSLFLRSDGSWATAVNTNYVTNSLPEAPNDGYAYARKNEAWTGLAIADVSGLTSFGSFWVTSVADSVDALTQLALVGGGAATIDSPAKYVVRIGSSGSGVARHRLNVVPGTAISVGVVDDSVDDESDLTIGLTNLLSTHITDSTTVGRALLKSTNESSARVVLQLGTAATRDVPTSGNALSNQVVLGSDTRMTNARMPVSHEHALADLPMAPAYTVVGNISVIDDAEPEYINITNLAQALRLPVPGGLGTGNVGSVALSAPGIFTVSGSPIISNGTIAIGTAPQTAGTAWMGPVSGVASSPTFRRQELTDLPAGVWTLANDGALSGLDADLLDGQHGTWYLDRGNHVGAINWSIITGTPTNRAGYGIIDAAGSADLAAHIANSVTDGSRPHGVGEFGGILASSSSRGVAQAHLLLQSAAYSSVPPNGQDAAVRIDGTDVVVATDTRLTNSRPPTAHGHTSSAITNVTTQRVIGRLTAGSGNAEEIPISTLAAAIASSGGGPTGTVRSVSLTTSMSDVFQIPPTAVTNTGSLTVNLQPQLQRLFLGSPASEYGFPSFRSITTNDIGGYFWTAANDGSGSGSDSDTVDGLDSTYLLSRLNHTGPVNWLDIIGTPQDVDGYGITNALKLTGGTLSGQLNGTVASFTNGILAQTPTRHETNNATFGLSHQSGPGADSSYGWQYPYGDKISYRGARTTLELVNTHPGTLSPSNQSIAFRYRYLTTWAPWRTLVDERNYTNWIATKTGGGASGTWGISITGDAGGVPWSGVQGTPTNLVGYGIQDATSLAEFVAHTNLTAGAHGISPFGSTLVDDADAAAARTTLGLGTSATRDAPSSGNATSAQVVLGSDTRLTDSRVPTSHQHPVSEISDSGSFGRQLVQTSVKTNALNLLGSGGATGLYLTWDGWATAPSYTGPTNILGEAPTNGLMYGRKNAAWTQVSMSDISGMSVGLSVPAPFSVSGSPVTSSGTLAVSVSNQVEKTFWAGPVSGANAPPGFRAIQLTDLPSGIPSTTLGGQSNAYFLNRTNHIGTQAFSTLHSTPTTRSGYGITDVPTYSDLAAHTNLTAGAHGISSFGATLVDDANAATARTTLGLGSGAILNVASSGDAASGELVKGDDTRLTDPRDPTDHDHDWTSVTNTPTTRSGYGITDVPLYTDLAAHTNLTVGAHGISSFGYTIASAASAAVARTNLGLGTAATRDVPASGNAATNQAVLGNDTRLTDARTPTAHTQAFSTITSTPTTKSGYGITDVPTYSDLASHTNLTVGAHGLTAFGLTIAGVTNAAIARTNLGLGTAATLNVAVSGDAASGEVVKGSDTRLTDSRTPISHNHQTSHLTNVASKTVVGRLTVGTGNAEQISLSNLVSALRTDGGLSDSNVTSVGLSMPGIFNVTGSPVTSSGTLAASLANQAANTFLAGAVTGSPTTPFFRTISIYDIPGGVWTTNNMGAGSGLVSDKLDGYDSSYFLDRANHTGTQGWGTITGKPTTRAGYGITDVPLYTDLAAHTNLTVGAHGITAFGSTLAGAASAAVARTNLGLGTAALLNAPASGNASSTEVVKGNDTRLSDARAPLEHYHDDRYDISGTAAYQMFVHTNNANPHSQYMLASGGSSVNQSAQNITISGSSTLSDNVALNLSDVTYGGAHRFVIRGSADGQAWLSTPNFTKGILDYHIADIVDAGSVGQDLVQASSVGAALDVLGSGRSGSTYLRGDGTWATPPSGGSPTNGITDAPSDGTAYVRKNSAWTGMSASDLSGLTPYGSYWITSVSDDVDALTALALIGGGAATIDSLATIQVRQNNTGTGAARHRINFVGNSGISLSVSDDSVSDEADVAIGLATGDYGDVTVGGGGSTMTVDDNAISYAKIQNVTASRVLGRSDSGSGPPQELSLGQGLQVSGTTVLLNPATFISGQVLYVQESEAAALTSGQLTDFVWRPIIGPARAGTSATIPANTVPVGGTIKIELYGEMEADDSLGDTMGQIRVLIGTNYSATFKYSNEDSIGAPAGTPWSLTLLVTLKAGSAVKTTGMWQYANYDNDTVMTGRPYMVRPTVVGTINPTSANALSVEFRGQLDGSSKFSQFGINQAIVTRY